MSLYYAEDEPGVLRPIDTVEWRVRFEDFESRKIASTWVSETVHVSTVYLGLNHEYGEGPPLIYETMIFGGPLDQSQWRYTYRAEAEAGHDVAVATARAALEQGAS